MKKFLQIGRQRFLLPVLLLVVGTSMAQTTAITSGNWNNVATWSAGIPTSTDAVTINNGITVTVTNTATCASISISGGNSANGITISGSNSLTVSGAVSISSGTGSGDNRIINVGAGSFSCASVTMNTTGNNNRFNRISISTGTVTVSGDIIMNDNSTRNNIVFSGSGTLNVGGALTGGGVTVSTSTINYNGTIDQTVRNLTYNNLTVSGSGVKTLAGTVNNTLTIAETATTAGSISYATNGILKYNGSAAQTTSNVEFPASMSGDVVIDNAAGVTLNGAKALSGSLTLTNGVLYSTTSNLLTFNDGFATVNGGSATSYVDGPVRKNGNDASFTYPVGKNGVYAPVTITGPESNGDAFTVEYKRQSATAMGPVAASLSGQIYAISNCEYWDINETVAAGTPNSINITASWSAGSGCGGGSYITDVTKLTLVHFNGTEWDSYGGTASGTNSNGTITRTGVTSFSPFALGSTSFSANPLPVSFSNVKAFEKGTAVQIDWTNLTESDMNNYVIERSANGIDFTEIGTVAPRSNQVDAVSYSFMDMSPLSGTGFYRIKAVEVSGKTVYTKSLRVNIGQGPKGITLYPNPVQGSDVNVSFSASRGVYQLNVLNAAGQIVFRQQLNHAGGNAAQTLSLPASLKTGVYSLLISGDNYKETTRFVVQ